MHADWFTPDREVFGGYMYVTPEIRTKGRGVQGKIIKKYVIKELFDPFLQRWLKQREELGITCPELFVSRQGNTYKPAVVSTANSFAERISKIFNIEYYTHSSRHFFCTYLKRMKLPDDVIVQIFGWADTAMLKIYNDIPAEEALSEFFLNFMKQKEDAANG